MDDCGAAKQTIDTGKYSAVIESRMLYSDLFSVGLTLLLDTKKNTLAIVNEYALLSIWRAWIKTYTVIQIYFDFIILFL